MAMMVLDQFQRDFLNLRIIWNQHLSYFKSDLSQQIGLIDNTTKTHFTTLDDGMDVAKVKKYKSDSSQLHKNLCFHSNNNTISKLILQLSH